MVTSEQQRKVSTSALNSASVQIPMPQLPSNHTCQLICVISLYGAPIFPCTLAKIHGHPKKISRSMRSLLYIFTKRSYTNEDIAFMWSIQNAWKDTLSNFVTTKNPCTNVINPCTPVQNSQNGKNPSTLAAMSNPNSKRKNTQDRYFQIN